MGFSLFPRVVRFFDLFARQNQQIVTCAEALHAIFVSSAEARTKCAGLQDLKSASAGLSLDIARQLADTFIAPIDREDIYALNLAQENLLAAVIAVASRFCLYGFFETKDAPIQLAANLHKLVKLNGDMIDGLKDKRTTDADYSRACEVKHESDALLLVALGEVYESFAETPQTLFNIMKWGQIYDRLEEALSGAAAVANLLQGVSVKNA